MIAGIPTPMIGQSLTGQPSAQIPTDKREAAQAFEALLIGQLLRSTRDASSSGGWLGTGVDKTTESLAEFAEQQVSQMLSASGGLGLSGLILQGLERDANHSSSEAASPHPSGHSR